MFTGIGEGSLSATEERLPNAALLRVSRLLTDLFFIDH